MLVRKRITKAIIKNPGSTARELSKRLSMSDGGVAGHLHHLEKSEFVRREMVDNVSRWYIGDVPDKNYADVAYIGNRGYRVYLKEGALEGSTQLAEEVAELMRDVVPELKYARAFTDTVRVPVKRNKLIKL